MIAKIAAFAALIAMLALIACSGSELVVDNVPTAPAATKTPIEAQAPTSVPTNLIPSRTVTPPTREAFGDELATARAPVPSPTPVADPQEPVATAAPSPEAPPENSATPTPGPAATAPATQPLPDLGICPQMNGSNDLLIECYQQKWERLEGIHAPQKEGQFNFPSTNRRGEQLQADDPSSFPTYAFSGHNLALGRRHDTIVTEYNENFEGNDFAHFFDESYTNVPRQKAEVNCKYLKERGSSRQKTAERFLENPWFKTNDLVTFLREHTGCETQYGEEKVYYPNHPLSEAIAAALAEEIEKQTTELEWNKPELRWFNGLLRDRFDKILDKFTPDIREDNLQDYLQATAWVSRNGTRTLAEGYPYQETQYDFRTPLVSWELISDELPIVQVTAWNKTNLPYKREDRCNEEWRQNQCGITQYAVTFVVAFQDCGDEQGIQPYNLLGDIVIQVFENEEYEEGILNEGKDTIPFDGKPQSC